MVTERVNLRLVGGFADELRSKMEAELAETDALVRARVQEDVPEETIAAEIAERLGWAGFKPNPSEIADYIRAVTGGDKETFPAITVVVNLGDLKEAGLRAEFG